MYVYMYIYIYKEGIFRYFNKIPPFNTALLGIQSQSAICRGEHMKTFHSYYQLSFPHLTLKTFLISLDF